MAKVILHGPLSGLYKATYDTERAELTIRHDDLKIVLDEWECDNLLRVLEAAQDPIEDLAEFFNDLPGTNRFGWRLAQGFASHDRALARLVYA